jgi:hypothetical protein
VDALANLSPDELRLQNHLRVKQGLPPIADSDTNLCCGGCNEWKPDEEFYSSGFSYDRGKRRGRKFFCKKCDNARRLLWRYKNFERDREVNRVWKRKQRGPLTRDVACPYCEELFHKKGLGFHKKHCLART